MFSGQQLDQALRLTQIDSVSNKIVFTEREKLAGWQANNSTILCVATEDLCYMQFVLIQYSFSGIVNRPII